MAEVEKYRGQRSGVINTTNGAGEYVIGNVGVQGGTWTVHLESSSFSGSITVMGRATKPTHASASLTEVAIPYRPLHINGSVAASTDEVSTAITGTSLIQIPVADGIDLILDATSVVSGTMTYHAYPSS